VDGVDAEDARVALGGRVELADEPVAVQDWHRSVAPAALGRRFVHLELVVVLEQLRQPLPVVHEPFERRFLARRHAVVSVRHAA
jgi:hypothetical protein